VGINDTCTHAEIKMPAHAGDFHYIFFLHTHFVCYKV